MLMTKSEAVDRAVNLLSRVRGSGWRYVITGPSAPGGLYTYHVTNNYICLYEEACLEGEDPPAAYHTSMTVDKGMAWGDHELNVPKENFTDPNEAVKAQMDKAREYFNQVNAMMLACEASMTPLQLTEAVDGPR